MSQHVRRAWVGSPVCTLALAGPGLLDAASGIGEDEYLPGPLARLIEREGFVGK